jgi:hypothetical protein
MIPFSPLLYILVFNCLSWAYVLIHCETDCTCQRTVRALCETLKYMIGYIIYVCVHLFIYILFFKCLTERSLEEYVFKIRTITWLHSFIRNVKVKVTQIRP